MALMRAISLARSASTAAGCSRPQPASNSAASRNPGLTIMLNNSTRLKLVSFWFHESADLTVADVTGARVRAGSLTGPIHGHFRPRDRGHQSDAGLPGGRAGAGARRLGH